jgi:hypothetical protein
LVTGKLVHVRLRGTCNGIGVLVLSFDSHFKWEDLVFVALTWYLGMNFTYEPDIKIVRIKMSNELYYGKLKFKLSIDQNMQIPGIRWLLC